MNRHRTRSGIIDRVLLPYTPWALLLLIPITFIGFYPSYYSTFHAPAIIHLHGAVMLLWLALAIIQPWLVHTNKMDWHRLVGRLSYILIPCVLLTGYFVLRHGYLRVLDGDIVAPPEYYPEGVTPLTKAADFTVISSVYFAWLLLYFVLGIINRRNTPAHATFMLAATLTILGPGADRLIGHICDALGWPYNAVAENFTFGIVFVVFLPYISGIAEKGYPFGPPLPYCFYTLPVYFCIIHCPFTLPGIGWRHSCMAKEVSRILAVCILVGNK